MIRAGTLALVRPNLRMAAHESSHFAHGDGRGAQGLFRGELVVRDELERLAGRRKVGKASRRREHESHRAGVSATRRGPAGAVAHVPTAARYPSTAGADLCALGRAVARHGLGLATRAPIAVLPPTAALNVP